MARIANYRAYNPATLNTPKQGPEKQPETHDLGNHIEEEIGPKKLQNTNQTQKNLEKRKTYEAYKLLKHISSSMPPPESESPTHHVKKDGQDKMDSQKSQNANPRATKLMTEYEAYKPTKHNAELSQQKETLVSDTYGMNEGDTVLLKKPQPSEDAATGASIRGVADLGWGDSLSAEMAAVSLRDDTPDIGTGRSHKHGHLVEGDDRENFHQGETTLSSSAYHGHDTGNLHRQSYPVYNKRRPTSDFFWTPSPSHYVHRSGYRPFNGDTMVYPQSPGYQDRTPDYRHTLPPPSLRVRTNCIDTSRGPASLISPTSETLPLSLRVGRTDSIPASNSPTLPGFTGVADYPYPDYYQQHTGHQSPPSPNVPSPTPVYGYVNHGGQIQSWDMQPHASGVEEYDAQQAYDQEAYNPSNNAHHTDNSHNTNNTYNPPQSPRYGAPAFHISPDVDYTEKPAVVLHPNLHSFHQGHPTNPQVQQVQPHPHPQRPQQPQHPQPDPHTRLLRSQTHQPQGSRLSSPSSLSHPPPTPSRASSNLSAKIPTSTDEAKKEKRKSNRLSRVFGLKRSEVDEGKTYIQANGV